MARGRRRRVLNDEARSASGAILRAAGERADADPDAPRYGELASVENHPQITDYVPRRKRAVLAALVAGVGTAATAAALAHFAEPVAAVMAGLSADDVRSAAGALAAWTAAITLLAAAGLARLVFSLRRHRVDDYSGRYRVWRWVAFGSLAASANAVVAGHELVSRWAVAATGWSLTASGAEWWLAPAALVGMWFGFKLLLEIAESRIALVAAVLSLATYGAAAAGALGWAPAWLAGWTGVLTETVPLVGHTLALVALVLFARYVVLDVQGLIEHTPRPAAKVKAKTTAREYAPKPLAVAPSTTTPVAASLRTPAEQNAARAAVATANRWTDPDGDEEEDESAGERPLTKAERKRLRKQNRAA